MHEHNPGTICIICPFTELAEVCWDLCILQGYGKVNALISILNNSDTNMFSVLPTQMFNSELRVFFYSYCHLFDSRLSSNVGFSRFLPPDPLTHRLHTIVQNIIYYKFWSTWRFFIIKLAVRNCHVEGSARWCLKYKLDIITFRDPMVWLLDSSEKRPSISDQKLFSWKSLMRFLLLTVTS